MDELYIQSMDYEEKLVFLKIFCKVIKADGSVDSEEINFLKMIASRYGIDNNRVVEIIKSASTIDYISEAHKIKNRQHALELVKELCVLANIDEGLEDTELDIIIDVARAMGVEDEKVILINRWVLDSLILNKTGQIIMEKDNG